LLFKLQTMQAGRESPNNSIDCRLCQMILLISEFGLD